MSIIRYFTPELYMRLQNLRDQDAFDEWDRRLERYDVELTRLLPRFPESVKYYLSNVRLHDAEILSMGLTDSTLTMTLQLQPPDMRLVTLTYTLAEAPQILRGVYDAAFCSPQAEYMYDEISLDEVSGVLTHDILLGNGWEVRLRFRALEITWSEALLPVRSAALPCSA